MRFILATLLAVATAVITALAVLTTAVNAHANDVEWVTYCEVNKVSGYHVVFIETSYEREFTVLNQTVRRGAIQGQRDLVESPVDATRPTVNSCKIRVVNGQWSAVLTTVGGAEWLVVNPRINR